LEDENALRLSPSEESWKLDLRDESRCKESGTDQEDRNRRSLKRSADFVGPTVTSRDTTVRPNIGESEPLKACEMNLKLGECGSVLMCI
jgi:hypothetical protein